MREEQILVGDWMSAPAVVVSPDTSMVDAYELMMERGIRRLPVVEGENLAGIVTLGDLREARPSPATSLSIYELNYLLARLKIREVMTHHPYTVTPATPVQAAARIMLEHKVGGLPVVDKHGKLLGILTESDIFRMLVEQWDRAVGFQTQRADLAAVAG